MSETVTAYIGIGSNLGDRAGIIRSAISALNAVDEVRVITQSRVIETEPMGTPGQGKYLNGAVGVMTSLEPRALLGVCLQIERKHGRDRSREIRWGPRTLDLDLLLYGKRIISEPGLIIPHPRMHERPFVLIPLAQIGPSQWHPVREMTIQTLRDRLAVTQ